MIDTQAISERFFSCYHGKSRRDLARLFEVRKQTITSWATRAKVPWERLKYLSDSQAISWDWLLDGLGPKESTKEPVVPPSTQPQFDTLGINQRFLSLFGEMSQTEIAKIFDITPAAVNEWKAGTSQVAWKRLDYAVCEFGVRWDWLIDGLEPKYRRKR